MNIFNKLKRSFNRKTLFYFTNLVFGKPSRSFESEKDNLSGQYIPFQIFSLHFSQEIPRPSMNHFVLGCFRQGLGRLRRRAQDREHLNSCRRRSTTGCCYCRFRRGPTLVLDRSQQRWLELNNQKWSKPLNSFSERVMSVFNLCICL